LIYSSHPKVRDTAWQCLIDYNINSLPVDLLKIIKAMGIILRKNSNIFVLTGSQSGKTFFRNGKFYIVYDDECSMGRQLFTIAHKLGHILLGHVLSDSVLYREFVHDKPLEEKNADMFAARLLSPACVLWAFEIYGAEDISKLCGVSIAAAKNRA
jgi:Zn-dependent peptidase ImmA (M78 family)